MIRVFQLALFFFLFLPHTRAACKCAISHRVPNQVPNTVFTFSDNRRIAVCGFKDIHIASSEAEYSDFIMSECNADTIIDYWDASSDIVIKMENDTIVLESRELLATGEDFKLERETWLIEYMFYKNGMLHRKKILNPELRYMPSQVSSTLKQYKHTRFRTQAEMKDEEKTAAIMQLANQLMIAAISGSHIAEKYFYELAERFQPYGKTAEWYDDMAGMLRYARQGD